MADPLPDAVAFHDLLGDPVVRATGSSTFYYASVAERFLFENEDSFVAFSGISVSKSTNGGFSWGPAVTAAEGDEPFDFIFDKPWMAVKSGSPDSIYITYIKFVFEQLGELILTSIELVKSTDRGVSWSGPTRITEESEVEEIRKLVTNS